MPFETYLAWEACHFSILKLFERSALHAREALVHPAEQTAAQLLGQALHTAVLEPNDFEKRYVRAPHVDRRTKEGKAAWAVFEVEHPHALLLSADEHDACLEMRDAAWHHATAVGLLSGPGANELAVVWEDPDAKRRCKARLDRLTEFAGWTTIMDVKTTRDASPKGFAREIATYQYQMQNAFYLDGLEALAPRERRFVFLAIEKTPPYAVACYELDPGSIELGRRAYKAALSEWSHAEETGLWPGYPPGIRELSLPPWAFKEVED